MNDAAIITLAAVAIGWFLNELSGTFRIAREEKQLLKAAIPVLIQLYFEQYRINEILSFLAQKMGDDFENLHKAVESTSEERESVGHFLKEYLVKHEEMRKINVALPKHNRESIIDGINQATIELSRVDPVSAYNAKKFLSEFILFQESELPVTNESFEYYLKHWEMMLLVFQKDLSALRELILDIAKKSGLVEYFRVRRLIADEEGDVRGGMKKAYRHMDENT